MSKPMWQAAWATMALALAACSLLPAPMAGPPQNRLTAAEESTGWRLLFNGRDLTGWRGYRKEAPGATWTVEDGALTLTAGGAGDIITTEEFSDFELRYDWKISPRGNSGVMYFVKESVAAPQTYNTGPEMQVLDDDGHADGRTPSHRAGALYDLVAPPPNVTRPVGEWNEARIRVADGRIEHWLNGKLTAESPYGDNVWRAMVAKSKFSTMPLFGTALRGHIAIQDHGDRVWYRNIKIRTL